MVSLLKKKRKLQTFTYRYSKIQIIKTYKNNIQLIIYKITCDPSGVRCNSYKVLMAFRIMALTYYDVTGGWAEGRQSSV